MELTLKIMVGLTPEVERLAEELLSLRRAETPPAVTAEKSRAEKPMTKEDKSALLKIMTPEAPKPSAVKTESGKAEADASKAGQAPAKEAQPAAKPEATQAADPQQPAPQPEAPAADAAKPLTKEDVRREMDAIFEKFEGPGWQEKQPDALHKTIVAAFKNAASLLGADRPTALPEEKRPQFIETINNFELQPDGTICPKLPF